MIQYTLKRHAGLLLSILLLSATADAATRNYSVTSISYGAYQTSDGTDTLNGSQLAIGYLSYFTEQWAYFVRFSSASAIGQHLENNITSELSARALSLAGGLQWSYDLDLNNDKRDDVTPYIGAGLAFQNYQYEFDYADSEVGKTSGTGYGPLAIIGIKISLSANIVLIPAYQYEQLTIKTESGSDRSFTSSGFSLAFVARF